MKFRNFDGILLSLFMLGAAATGASAQQSPPASPSIQVELSAIGYHVPSRMDRLSESQTAVTLDFVDDHHVLLTYNQKKLWKRLPHCPPAHEDRLMHAAILELPSGKVISETDWYLHDRRPYLWPLDPGEFLLRRGNELYLIDSSLQEKLLLKSVDDLLWVTITPDARQIVIETPNSAKRETNAKSQSAPKYLAKFLDAKTVLPQRTLPLNDIVDLTATSTGYADLIHKNDIWLLRFGPVQKHRHNLARVRSQTQPSVLYSTNNSLLIGRCPAPNCDYSVTSFTLNGRHLWQQHWPRYRFFPTITRSGDSSRFAVGSLQLAANTPATVGVQADQEDALKPEISQLDVFQQDVQVFETASGTSLFSLTVSPGMMSGRNYALSPDGRQIVAVQNSSLDVYDLPPSSNDEQAKFAELKSDLPDSYSVSSDADSAALTADEGSGDSLKAPTSEAESANAASPSPAEPAAASTSPSPSAATHNSAEPLTTIRVTTKTVLVDVVVTDSKGHPIKGLSEQDFHVTEDGHPQELHSFREFNDGHAKADPVAAGTSPAHEPEKPSPNVFTNHAHAPDAGGVTLVLFDMLNTPAQDQAYARQQLIKFLETKPKNMQFALCVMSRATNHVQMLQGFTPDENLLLLAAKGRKGMPREAKWQVAMGATTNNVNTVQTLAQGGRTSGFQNLLGALEQTQTEQELTDTGERAAITLDSMMLLAEYLSGLPGRKNIVWLSGSFPIAISGTTNSGNIALDNPNYVYKIKRVTNLLAEGQVAVYPVDVRGLISGGSGAQGAGGAGGPTSIDPQDISANSVTSPTAVIPQDMQALARDASERDTLLEFATDTGGKAFFNTNGIREAIATAAEQGTNYYTLSYNPSNRTFDGKFRKIKVQLAQKGYTLHYRQGYYADDLHTSARETELLRRTRIVAMEHGTPLSHQLLFSVRVSPVGSKSKSDSAKIGAILPAASKKSMAVQSVPVETQHYVVDYTINGSELRFTPLVNSKYQNTLTLMATSFNREGRMLTGFSSIGTRELTAPEFAKAAEADYGVQQEIDIPLQASFLRLGLFDQMSNRLGTVEIPLPVPPDPELQRAAKSALPPIEPD